MLTFEHHQGVFRNLLGEPIELRIVSTKATMLNVPTTTIGPGADTSKQFENTEVRQTETPNEIRLISIDRDRSSVMQKFWIRGLVVGLLLYSIVAYFASNWIRSHAVWSLLLVSVSMPLLVYIAQPVVNESIILLAGLEGIQFTRGYLFGCSRSTFINTRQLMINEAITMQQVIFYLVAIPPRLEPYILETDQNPTEMTTKTTPGRTGLSRNASIYDTSRSTETCADSSNHVGNQVKPSSPYSVSLIPLFLSTVPRLDCLKIIYQHLIAFNEAHNQSYNLKTIESRTSTSNDGAATAAASIHSNTNSNHVYNMANGFIQSNYDDSNSILPLACKNLLECSSSAKLRKKGEREENYIFSSSLEKESTTYPLLRLSTGHYGGSAIR